MKRLSLIISIFLFIACEDKNNDFPKDYTFYSFETGEVRIFTKNGEIENKLLSENFTSQWSKYFYRPDSFKIDDFDFNAQISLQSNNQSILYNSDTIMNYGFTKINEVLYFETADTFYIKEDLANTKNERFKYSPITQTNIKEFPSFGIPSVTYYYGYLNCIYALDYGDKIKFPFTSFLEKNCSKNNSSDTAWAFIVDCYNIEAYSNVNNSFNQFYLDKKIFDNQFNPNIEPNDTVVIQENFVVFRKN